jgi:heme exporter protein D
MRAIKFAVSSPIAKLMYVWISVAMMIAIPTVVYRNSYDAYMTTVKPETNPNCAPAYTRECNAHWTALVWAFISPFIILASAGLIMLITWTLMECMRCHAKALAETQRQWQLENAKKNE